jgi:hypothetical protein
MLMAIAAEMVARLQPNASSNGTISTDGAARTPAATRSRTKVTPTTTQA